MSVQAYGARFIRWSRLLFTPIAMSAVAWFLFANYSSVLGIAKTARLDWLLLSVALWCVVNITVPIVTHKLFSARNQNIPLSKLAGIHLGRLPAKYIPGGIWHTAARGIDYLEAGITRRELFNVLVTEHVMALMITAGVGGAGIYLYTNSDFWSYIGLVAGLLAFTGLAGAVFMLFRKRDKDSRMCFLEAFITQLLVWVFASSSFLVYYEAFEFYGVDNSPLYVILSYMFSWSLGFVAFFTPQGFGVFEVVIADLLTPKSTVASVAFIFLGFRFAILASDMIVYLTYLLIIKISHKTV